MQTAQEAGMPGSPPQDWQAYEIVQREVVEGG